MTGSRQTEKINWTGFAVVSQFDESFTFPVSNFNHIVRQSKNKRVDSQYRQIKRVHLLAYATGKGWHTELSSWLP